MTEEICEPSLDEILKPYGGDYRKHPFEILIKKLSKAYRAYNTATKQTGVQADADNFSRLHSELVRVHIRPWERDKSRQICRLMHNALFDSNYDVVKYLWWKTQDGALWAVTRKRDSVACPKCRHNIPID